MSTVFSGLVSFVSGLLECRCRLGMKTKLKEAAMNTHELFLRAAEAARNAVPDGSATSLSTTDYTAAFQAAALNEVANAIRYAADKTTVTMINARKDTP